MLSRGKILPLVSNVPSIILITLSILSIAIAPRLMKKEAAAQKAMEQKGKEEE